jgi:multiple sugar transport system substrate-binding protein
MGPKSSLFLLFLVCIALGIARGDFSALRVVTPVGGEHAPLEIDFWNGFTGPDGRVMLELVRQFNLANSDVHVSMQRILWATYYNKLMVSALDHRGPEVFVLQSALLPRMDRAGIVDTVDDLFTDPALVAEFEPSLLDRVNVGSNGKIRRIGLPLDTWPQGLYCNAKMFKAAGITNADGSARPPTNGREFFADANALQHHLHDGDPSNIWGFGYGDWTNNFMSLVPQFGGQILDASGNPTLDHPGNVAALQYLADLNLKYHLAPSPEGGVAGWVGFRQERVAMEFDGIYMVGDLKRLTDLDYIGAPLPQIGPYPGTLGDSHILCIRKGLNGRQREGAKRFIRFISDHSLAWADAGQVPARKSARQSEAFKKLQVQYAFSKQLDYVMYPPKTPLISELMLYINLAVEKGIRGRTTAHVALHQANKDYKNFLEHDRLEQTASQK